MPQEFESVNDEIKNEAKKVWQSKTGKERAMYFVDYYKVHFIVGVVVIALLISIIHSFATRKENIFEVLVGILFRDADENHEAGADGSDRFFFNGDTGFSDSLDNCSHRELLFQGSVALGARENYYFVAR